MSQSGQSGKQKTRPPVRSVADKPEHQPLLRSLPATQVPTGPRLPSAGPATTQTLLPGSYLKFEQPPISAFNDNPVFDERGAAQILRLSPDQLKKWRQRNMGPDYIQYGPRGPVRYAFNALMAFLDSHTVRPSRKKK
jgi:hypothetical protein